MKINGKTVTCKESKAFNFGLYGIPSDDTEVWNAACISDNFKVKINEDLTWSYFDGETEVSEEQVKELLWKSFKAMRVTYLQKGNY